MSTPDSSSDTMAAPRREHRCGPVALSGGPDALYERHLFFDNVIALAAAGARERYEAFARSVSRRPVAWHYDNQPEVQEALDPMFSDNFSGEGPGERSHDRRIRGRHLAREAVPGAAMSRR